MNKAAENYYPNFPPYFLIKETGHLEYDQITTYFIKY